ncbi:MAG TPA: N-acetylglucosamine-6-phosphate deacetylase [Polyangia bacterium]|nr:N-acetylglucosamine-6-phosphate deacetylase [Polyangia bacterium]
MKTESPRGHNRFSVAGRLLVAGRLVEGAAIVDGERIVEVRESPVGTLPEPRLTGAIVSPGLVDLQCNGGFGVEVGGDAAALRELARRLPATGVTTFLPTLVSAGPAAYRAAAASWVAAARQAPGAAMPGLHLEGPLLAPARAGAHDRRAIADADATLDDVLDELLDADAVRIVTLAPERPGALERIARLCAAGVTVSLGHTDGSFAEITAGIQAGARLATHLYSAMSPFAHRAPGAVGAVLTDDRVTATVIADGVHTHPAALMLALRAKGAERIALVTDAVAAAGAPAGRYRLGGLEVVSDGTSARLLDGTLAGSTLTMDAAVRAMVTLGGATPAEALSMASIVPADAIGLRDRGRLALGQRADLVLWSADLAVETTIAGGAVAFP